MEVWRKAIPAQFTYSALKLTGEFGEPGIFALSAAVQDLAKTDPGLNEGITESYFDFTSVASLSEGEKEGLALSGRHVFRRIRFSVHTGRNWRRRGSLIGKRE